MKAELPSMMNGSNETKSQFAGWYRRRNTKLVLSSRRFVIKLFLNVVWIFLLSRIDPNKVHVEEKARSKITVKIQAAEWNHRKWLCRWSLIWTSKMEGSLPTTHISLWIHFLIRLEWFVGFRKNKTCLCWTILENSADTIECFPFAEPLTVTNVRNLVESSLCSLIVTGNQINNENSGYEKELSDLQSKLAQKDVWLSCPS